MRGGKAIGTVTRIPTPVIRRLAEYRTHLQYLKQNSKESVSSQELAQALSLSASCVRQDLSHVDFSGTPKSGYGVNGLEEILTDVLGLRACRNAVIVGAGNLGRALALHEDFPRRGFKICGVFDSNPKLFGKKLGHLVVESMDVLSEMVRKLEIDIGVIAVPASAAQEVASELVAAGVSGLLNLACAHVTAPEDVAVVDARLVEKLQELSYAIRMRSDTR